jgi:aspartyl protease family protein
VNRLFAPLLLLAASAASAQTVTLNGSIGERAALLVIDGQPRTVAVGANVMGVKLLSVGVAHAEIEVGGQRRTLPIGTPVSVGGAATAGGTQIVLAAGSGGHYFAAGSINGRAVQFMVDTGATTVALSAADADRIGLKWRDAPRALAQTANGVTVMHVVMLSSVRIGDVEIPNVEATVVPAPMPHVLLGNSFLRRFQLRQENDILRLEKR